LRQYIKHTAIITFTNVGAKVLTLAFFAILARMLTVDYYGYFRYLLNISTIFGIVFAGIATALTKFLGESNGNHDRKYYTADSVIFLAISFLASAVLAIIFSIEYLSLIFLTLAILIEYFYMGFARGIFNMTKLAGFRLAENILRFGVLVVFYFAAANIKMQSSVIIYSLSGVLAMVLFEVAKPQLRLRFHFVKERIKNFIQYSANVMLGNIGGTLLIAINPILISKFHGNDSVGYYSVGLALTQLFGFLPEAITLIALPRIASLEDKGQAVKPILIASAGCLALSALIFIPLYFFREMIITVIFTNKFLESTSVILPLSAAQIFISIYFILATYWQAIDKPWVPTAVITILCVVNAGISYFFTRDFGIVGASYALAISSLIAFIALFFLTFKNRENNRA
jgi:O-antigen/teichoic acid export membrane protein